ncbi:MAG: HEPN domain-containing protein [Euryarchaeota archaeon]|nr:HEPN domain-containing protein [Euryarchaeota archaeon]
MKEDIDVSELIEKAKESLDAAKSLFENGFYGFSAGRSCYAMFYTAEAVLLTKNLSFSKHSAVIGAFGKEFVKTEILPRRLREYMVSAFDIRQLGDYGAPGSVHEVQAQLLIRKTQEFIETIEILDKGGVPLMRSAERYTHNKDLQSQKLDTIIGRLGHTGVIGDYDMRLNDLWLCHDGLVKHRPLEKPIDLLKNQ